jgi:hypothetical protein
MGTFVRVTLIVAALIVTFAALVLILKLLVVAAIVAAVIIGIGLLARALGLRFGPNWRARVTTLTARR